MALARTDDPAVERVRELLSYDPVTGAFRWRVSRPGWAQAGRLAGYLHNKGYWMIGIDGYRCLGHRVAWVLMLGEWPAHRIDHRNTDRADNRWENLRAATDGQNNQNARTRSDNKSGFKGVCRRPSGRWRAQIGINGRPTHIGTYDTAEQAHAAYAAKAVELYGEFARTA